MDLRELWENSRSTIISAVIAIIVIAGLFFLFNALPNSQPAEEVDEQKSEEQKAEEAKKAEEEKKKQEEKEGKVSLPTTYTVQSGDSLWKISSKFYGTGYSWVVVARENKIVNPNVIHAGAKLTIPKAEVQASTPTNHTVVKGDTLWEMSVRYYGTGSQWTKIRDANPGQVGTLPNGNPLIKPGQVFKIP